MQRVTVSALSTQPTVCSFPQLEGTGPTLARIPRSTLEIMLGAFVGFPRSSHNKQHRDCPNATAETFQRRLLLCKVVWSPIRRPINPEQEPKKLAPWAKRRFHGETSCVNLCHCSLSSSGLFCFHYFALLCSTHYSLSLSISLAPSFSVSMAASR